MKMNHKFLSFLAPAFMAIAMGLGFAACSEDALDSGSPREGQITITLSSSKVPSRAATPGEDRLNENLIGNTHLYFYTDASSETDQPLFEYEATPNQTNSTTITLLMRDLNTLFGETGTTCKVYALTNLPAGTVIPSDDHSRKALRNLAITSPFELIEAQSSFVMDGESSVTFDRTTKTATGNVPLTRSAAKIILSVNVAPEVTEGEGTNAVTWTSNTNDMFVSFAWGVKTSIVNCTPESPIYKETPKESFFSKEISTKEGHKFMASGNTSYPFVQEIPFYSYPNGCGSDYSVHPYITFMVQWQRKAGSGSASGSEAQYCYYQIPVARHGDMELLRNNIYRINLNVEKLGSFVPTEPVELDWSYEVVDWSTVETDVNISDYRYLVLNQTEYTMNNENEITIPFYSSHDVTLADVTLTYWRYNENGMNGTPVSFNVTPEENTASRQDANDPRSGIYDVQYDNVNKTLTFYHDLKKTWTKVNGVFTPNNEDAYSPYTMTFTFHHNDKKKDDPTYAKTVTITQYPAMYIQVQGSPGWNRTFINSNNRNQYSDRDKWGDRYDFNPYADYWGGQHDWSTRRSLGNISGNGGYDYNLGSLRTEDSSSGNSNFNNYVITITKLNDAKYTIADPRQNVINNNLLTLINQNNTLVEDTSKVAFWSMAAPSFTDLTNDREKGEYIYNDDKTIRLLAYYYPTDERTSYDYFIAPKIRVASSKGTTSKVSKVGARRRCASYQENGRPAGRWRIPTKGEIEYISKLSAERKIPVLFTFGSEYWSASGKVSPNENGTLEYPETNDRSFVRCVYDEWYWKNDTLQQANKNIFTWGDRPYSDPETSDNNTTNP